jgi:hypothetical protein
MADGMPLCWRCSAAIDVSERIGRRDACRGRGSDLRCCRNCAFYAPGAHHDCREPQAEPQVDKERGNFCDWFSPGGASAAPADAAAVARAKLTALFGKK